MSCAEANALASATLRNDVGRCFRAAIRRLCSARPTGGSFTASHDGFGQLEPVEVAQDRAARSGHAFLGEKGWISGRVRGVASARAGFELHV